MSVALAACGMAVDIVLKIDLPKTATKVVGLGSCVSTVETTVKGKGRKRRGAPKRRHVINVVTFWTFLYRFEFTTNTPAPGIVS